MATAVAPPLNAMKPLAIFSSATAANKIDFCIPSVSRASLFSIARASGPKREAPNPNSSGQNLPFVPQPEDLEYLVKLGAGSVAGAVAIKYGSIIFPVITKPNLIEAITIITAPVVVVVLLIKQSRVE